MDLLSAVKDGNSSVALKIMAEGAGDVNFIDENGASLLHYEAWNKDVTFVSVLESLIANGAIVDAQMGSGGTPLHIASLRGNVMAMELLVAKGAHINAVDKDGSTPLHKAAVAENAAAAVAFLTSHGADVDVADNNGSTPLHNAARFGPVAAIKTLLANGGDVNARDEDSDTPLDGVNEMSLSYDMAVKCLKSEGASVNYVIFL